MSSVRYKERKKELEGQSKFFQVYLLELVIQTCSWDLEVESAIMSWNMGPIAKIDSCILQVGVTTFPYNLLLFTIVNF
jgi:hypothetical protein